MDDDEADEVDDHGMSGFSYPVTLDQDVSVHVVIGDDEAADALSEAAEGSVYSLA
jgi:hypothetical protein